MTENCHDRNETSSGTFTGDSMSSLKFMWRPIFFSFPEKLSAADDDTGTTVAALLGLTSDDTNEDVTAITTNNLPVAGVSDFTHPISTVNQAQVFGDLDLTTDLIMEDHVHDELTLQTALRRFTNKGALKACMGRTRYVTLTKNRPYKNFYIDKFLPRSVRRVVDRTYMAIQVHVPVVGDVEQNYYATTITPAVAHLGVKMVAKYNEWNAEHDQDMSP